MPKIKQVLKKAKEEAQKFADKVEEKAQNFADGVLSDKHERTENCYDTIKEANIQLCSSNDGTIITSYEQFKSIATGTIGRIDIAHEEILTYCIEEYRKVGVVSCEEFLNTHNFLNTQEEAPAGAFNDEL